MDASAVCFVLDRAKNCKLLVLDKSDRQPREKRDAMMVARSLSLIRAEVVFTSCYKGQAAIFYGSGDKSRKNMCRKHSIQHVKPV
jgi:hypothetical protein